MKELTIEQKAKAYDEAYARMSKAYNDNRCSIGFMNEIFPRLKENEDERIRNEIIAILQYKYEKYPNDPRYCNAPQWLDWLEKQCKVPVTIDIDKMVEDYSNNNERGNEEFGKPVNCMIRAYRLGITDTLSILNLEKQGVQKSIWHNEEEEPQKDSLILLIMQSGAPIVAKVIEPNHTFNHGERWAYIDDLLEKQGEQKPQGKTAIEAIKEEKADNKNCVKPVDKVEPKFHEGDWVVYNDNGDICQIKSIRDNKYCLWPLDSNIEGYLEIIDVDNEYHLWNITKDAKDGDVLSYRDGQWIFIYKKKIDDNSFCYHTLYSTIHQDLTINDAGFTVLSDAIIPATKEQRDLLFQKMKEAEYEWDSEKKELKKIEQKPAWSAEDKEIIEALISLCDEAQDNIPQLSALKNWLNSLKDRVQPQLKQEWNEEDESYLNTTIAYLKDAKEFKKTAENCINWLKSLKPQKQWKPSEEQMDALDDVISSRDIKYDVLSELWKDLKQL